MPAAAAPPPLACARCYLTPLLLPRPSLCSWRLPQVPRAVHPTHLGGAPAGAAAQDRRCEGWVGERLLVPARGASWSRSGAAPCPRGPFTSRPRLQVPHGAAPARDCQHPSIPAAAAEPCTRMFALAHSWPHPPYPPACRRVRHAAVLPGHALPLAAHPARQPGRRVGRQPAVAARPRRRRCFGARLTSLAAHARRPPPQVRGREAAGPILLWAAVSGISSGLLQARAAGGTRALPRHACPLFFLGPNPPSPHPSPPTPRPQVRQD